MTDALRQLIAHLQDEIRTYETSRGLFLPPAERAARIRERRAWIGALQPLLADETSAAPGRPHAE